MWRHALVSLVTVNHMKCLQSFHHDRVKQLVDMPRKLYGEGLDTVSVGSL